MSQSQLPPLPGHPEPHSMKWSELELAAIKEYGEQCARAALAANVIHNSNLGQVDDIDVVESELAAKVPAGYKLVPIEPTEEILRALTDPFVAINGDNRKAFAKAWAAMLAAAPACTCPSGDGSLRWPCPEHPAPEADESYTAEDVLRVCKDDPELTAWLGRTMVPMMGAAPAPVAAKVPADLPENETPQMHDAAMAVLYAGVTRGNTNALWRAYRAALLAATPAPAPVAAKKNEWRELALKFDGQRMAALSHLRMLLEHGEAHAEAARKFLAEPPRAAPAQAQQAAEADEELCRQAMQRWRDAKPEAQQPLTNEQIAEALEAGGVELQRFMGGISGAKDVWTTAGSASVPKIADVVRNLMRQFAAAKAKPEAQPLTAMQARSVVDGMGWALDEVEIEDMEMLVKAAERACAEAWGVKLAASGEAS